MAGSAFRPSFTEFTEFVVKPEQDGLERGYVRELFLQMHPVERKLLRYNMGATVFKIGLAAEPEASSPEPKALGDAGPLLFLAILP